jgi:hypothetical protein
MSSVLVLKDGVFEELCAHGGEVFDIFGVWDNCCDRRVAVCDAKVFCDCGFQGDALLLFALS